MRLKEALALPPSCAEQARQSSLSYLLGQGERHILPSFFNLLKHLQAQACVKPFTEVIGRCTALASARPTLCCPFFKVSHFCDAHPLPKRWRLRGVVCA